jgi:hypothetical protein
VLAERRSVVGFVGDKGGKPDDAATEDAAPRAPDADAETEAETGTAVTAASRSPTSTGIRLREDFKVEIIFFIGCYNYFSECKRYVYKM